MPPSVGENQPRPFDPALDHAVRGLADRVAAMEQYLQETDTASRVLGLPERMNKAESNIERLVGLTEQLAGTLAELVRILKSRDECEGR